VIVYLITTTLTEVVTNNAVAVIMTPIAIGLAGEIWGWTRGPWWWR
jgi:di/tricarboxylate transporter